MGMGHFRLPWGYMEILSLSNFGLVRILMPACHGDPCHAVTGPLSLGLWAAALSCWLCAYLLPLGCVSTVDTPKGLRAAILLR